MQNKTFNLQKEIDKHINLRSFFKIQVSNLFSVIITGFIFFFLIYHSIVFSNTETKVHLTTDLTITILLCVLLVISLWFLIKETFTLVLYVSKYILVNDKAVVFSLIALKILYFRFKELKRVLSFYENRKIIEEFETKIYLSKVTFADLRGLELYSASYFEIDKITIVSIDPYYNLQRVLKGFCTFTKGKFFFKGIEIEIEYIENLYFDEEDELEKIADYNLFPFEFIVAHFYINLILDLHRGIFEPNKFIIFNEILSEGKIQEEKIASYIKKIESKLMVFNKDDFLNIIEKYDLKTLKSIYFSSI